MSKVKNSALGATAKLCAVETAEIAATLEDVLSVVRQLETTITESISIGGRLLPPDTTEECDEVVWLAEVVVARHALRKVIDRIDDLVNAKMPEDAPDVSMFGGDKEEIAAARLGIRKEYPSQAVMLKDGNAVVVSHPHQYVLDYVSNLINEGERSLYSRGIAV